jgi:Kyakuja-Dileera-Zisupton transposase
MLISQVSLDVCVHIMDVLSLVAWLICTMEKGNFSARFTFHKAYKLQRQVYSDYCFCQASKYHMADDNARSTLLLIYDIICQWSINFSKRLDCCPGLSLVDADKLRVAIGKFHLAAHVPECFWKYSLNFKKGVGKIDGEILETVWSTFDDQAIRARAMSMAFRWEFLNQVMADHNFKKMISMGKMTALLLDYQLTLWLFADSMLCTKLKKAKQEIKKTKDEFDEQSVYAGTEKVNKWMKEEEEAQKKGGDRLKIYDVSSENGQLVDTFAKFY